MAKKEEGISEKAVKHTPGPWKFLPAFGTVEVVKFIVAYLSLSVEGRDNPLYLSKGEAEANGALIAAAPELLEALEGAVADPDNRAGFNWVLAAKSAIRKARGEQL